MLQDFCSLLWPSCNLTRCRLSWLLSHGHEVATVPDGHPYRQLPLHKTTESHTSCVLNSLFVHHRKTRTALLFLLLAKTVLCPSLTSAEMAPFEVWIGSELHWEVLPGTFKCEYGFSIMSKKKLVVFKRKRYTSLIRFQWAFISALTWENKNYSDWDFYLKVFTWLWQ